MSDSEVVCENFNKNLDAKVDSCLVDDGAGGAYDLLGEKNVPDLALEEETVSSAAEMTESTESSTEVILELNPIIIETKLDLNPTNDNKDSGIDSEKNSTPPGTSPPSPEATSGPNTGLDKSMVYDIREQERKGRISKKSIELQREQRKQHIIECKKRENQRAKATKRELAGSEKKGPKPRKKKQYWPKKQNHLAHRGKPQNNSPPYGNKQSSGKKVKVFNRRPTLDTTWKPKPSFNNSPKSAGNKGAPRRRTLDTTWMKSPHQKSPKSQNWKQNRTGTKRNNQHNNSPKWKNQKSHKNKIENFENLKITVSPGKKARKVKKERVDSETDKQIAKEVLLGLINPILSLGSPRSNASKTILDMLKSPVFSPSHRRRTLDTTWLNVEPSSPEQHSIFMSHPFAALNSPVQSGPCRSPIGSTSRVRHTLDTTWGGIDGNTVATCLKNEVVGDSLSEKFGKIQKANPIVVSKFSEWKRRQTLDTTWQ